jgi:FkbM family methyltransferase
MKAARAVLHRIAMSLRFHLESWRLVSRQYPIRVVQKGIEKHGLVFECHNLTEVNRVAYLDEEAEFMLALMRDLTPTDVFFDVGACIGVFALHAARRCREVVAFEPEPELRRHLESNVRLNRLWNVVVVPHALGERSGVAALFTDGPQGKSPSLRDAGYEHQVQVQIRSIDGLVAGREVAAPTVIKIDVEGAEMLVLRGMAQLLRSSPPRRIFLEIHPALLAGFASSETEVADLLRAAGYRLLWSGGRAQQLHSVFGRTS